MKIVIPLSQKDGGIVTLKEAKLYAIVQVNESMQIEDITYTEDFSQEFFEYIVTPDKNDDLDEAYELGARALLAREGMDIDEIIEAMMFRELDEIV